MTRLSTFRPGIRTQAQACAVAVGVACAAQAAAAQGDAADARSLLREALAALRTAPLGAEKVAWDPLEAELAAGLGADATLADAHGAIARAVGALNDPHARFEPPPGAQPPAARPAEPASPESGVSDSAPEETPAPPSVTTGVMLADGCAYVVVPGCFAPDVDGLQAFALRTAGEIARLEAEGPRAWVIDLRLNGGGNVWPMLLGLRGLLPEGALMTMHEPGGRVAEFGLSGDEAWIDWGGGAEAQLRLPADQRRAAPEVAGRVAVLIGPWTMSSGEALAICLRTLPEVRFLGEASAGLTTVTNIYPLADGSRLILPVAAMGDREARVVGGAIEPDRTVSFDAWPSADDAAASAARRWALRLPETP